MKLPPGYIPGLGVHKATAKGGFGERLLKQFGWTEGKGLGAKEDGMAEALKVKQKKDQTGVGANSSEQWRDKWWEDAFAQSVTNVAEVTEAIASGSSSDSDDSVAEVPQLSERLVHADGTASTATASEQALAQQLAKDPWGRFGGRQGKLARLRAQEQATLAKLAASTPSVSSSALAAAAATAAADPADTQPKAKRRKRSAAAAEETDASSAAQPKAKRKKGSEKAAAAAEVEKPAPTEAQLAAIAAVNKAAEAADRSFAAAVQAFRSTPLTGWWGAKRFISAGAMGATNRTVKPEDDLANGFTEATQENLYMALHNAKSAGKKGLGKGIGSGVVAGAKWEGSKKTFEEADEDQSEQTATQSPTEQQPAAPQAAAKSFKYSKLLRKLLQEAPSQRLGAKQLTKLVKQHWADNASKYGPPPADADLRAAMLAKVETLPDMTVKGKKVILSV